MRFASQMGMVVPIRSAYSPLPETYDEMVGADLRPRPGCQPIVEGLLLEESERIAFVTGRLSEALAMATASAAIGEAVSRSI